MLAFGKVCAGLRLFATGKRGQQKRGEKREKKRK
jgi:hypothetical protein